MAKPNLSDEIYPGEDARPDQVLDLAEAWRSAAHLLKPSAGQSHLSRAPFRFTAVHAIELYLNALLLHGGQEPELVRSLQHDLAKRKQMAIEGGLVLRARTAKHLSELAEGREYLKTRYGAGSLSDGHQPNRITATLDEIAAKVMQKLKPPSVEKKSPAVVKP